MKRLFIFLLMMTIHNMQAQHKAITEKKSFSQTTSVSIDINAEAESIWNILTNAKAFPEWNSTIVSLKGEIKTGEKIQLISTLDPERTFKIKVKEMQPYEKMMWGDGKGSRWFRLIPNKNGQITFEMEEKIGGLMFPMYKKYLPDFRASFEQFAADLKQVAEK